MTTGSAPVLVKQRFENQLLMILSRSAVAIPELPLTRGNSTQGRRRFAIIGGGPKGTYALERFVAAFKRHPLPEPVTVDVFESTGEFGAGQIYSGGNPDYLLMNYSSAHIDMWPREDRSGSGVSETPNLVDWLKTRHQGEASGDSFVSRRLVGEYLSDGFEAIVRASAPEVFIRTVPSAVVEISQTPDGKFSLEFENGHERSRETGYDRILMTTGHQFRSPSEKITSLEKEVTSVFPLTRLDPVQGGDTVAVRGMGLTFIDCAVALTEGRGGTFSESEDGSLVYHHSGNEPACIYPFSRSGRLMPPRGPQPPELNTPDPLASLIADGAEHRRGKIDFENEIRPLLGEAYLALGVDDFSNGVSQEDDVLEEFRLALDAIESGSAESRRCSVWPSAYASFRKLYDHGGLSPSSHRHFDALHAGDLARVSFGPPPLNARKILALANAGVLNFSMSRNPRLVTGDGQLELVGRDNKHLSITADAFINATMPGNRGETENLAPVYRSLIKGGLARFYDRDGYRLGCLEFDTKGRLIDTEGRPGKIHLYGTPTEGIVFDNDSLSREANDFGEPWAAACHRTCKAQQSTS